MPKKGELTPLIPKGKKPPAKKPPAKKPPAQPARPVQQKTKTTATARAQAKSASSDAAFAKKEGLPVSLVKAMRPGSQSRKFYDGLPEVFQDVYSSSIKATLERDPKALPSQLHRAAEDAVKFVQQAPLPPLPGKGRKGGGGGAARDE